MEIQVILFLIKSALKDVISQKSILITSFENLFKSIISHLKSAPSIKVSSSFFRYLCHANDKSVYGY